MKITSLFSLPLLALALLLGGCNSDSATTSQNAPSSGTGSVAVLMTDAPIDDFDRFLLTVSEISLLGEAGKVQIFSGSETIDLLDLNSHASLFSLADEVPAGHYHKIRMQVSDPVLQRLDADGNVVESVIPVISGNGKLDLNPRRELVVEPGKTLALQIDVDANKSLHLIQQGNGVYRFRPVIFVDVLNDGLSGKLVRVSGLVGENGADNFTLCHTNMYLTPGGDQSLTRSSHKDKQREEDDDDNEHDSDHDDEYDNDDGDHEHRHCIRVASDDDTVYFDASGAPLTNPTLNAGDPVTVLGYYQHQDHHRLGLQAEVVELAGKDVYRQYPGEIESLDLDRRSFELRDAANNLISVDFDAVSKFFSMSGKALNAGALKLGMRVKVEGVLISADNRIKAAALFLDDQQQTLAQLSGTISLLHDDLLGFDLVDATLGDVCVILDDQSNIYQLDLSGGSFSSTEVSITSLSAGQRLEAYGAFNLSGCFIARNILAEATP